MSKPTFSGHDSFECRHFWLKKGYDHIVKGEKFNDEAVITLGVGRNMVNSIRYWLKAYGLIDENENLTAFAKLIFDKEGFDPYIEDEATLWLLHYKIVSLDFASIYSILFNDFRRQKPEFKKEHLFLFCQKKFPALNENTFSKDFDALMKTYIPKGNEAEENYEGLLIDLNLVNEIKIEGKMAYVIKNDERNQLPEDIILFCILDKHKTNSIDFETLYSDKNSVGVVFSLTKECLANKLKAIAEKYKSEGIVFSDQAGIKELQFKKKLPDSKVVLKNYYSNVYAG